MPFLGRGCVRRSVCAFRLVLLAIVSLFLHCVFCDPSPGGGFPALLNDTPPPDTYALSSPHHRGSTRPDGLDATEIMVVATLDGSIHGVHRATGNILWTTTDESWGSLVKVTDVSAATSALTSTPYTPFEGLDLLTGVTDAVEDADDSVPTAAAVGADGVEADLLASDWVPDADAELLQQIQPFSSSQGIYIPEPAGNGDLYYYELGKTIKKLPLPIKRIVDDNHAFIFGEYVFTGKKVNRLFAIDPFTGDILRSYGDVPNETGGSDLPPEPVTDNREAIYISRTQYVLSMWDRQSSRLSWNITYGEFQAPHQPLFELENNSEGPHPGIVKPPPSLPSSGNRRGTDRALELYHPEDFGIRMKFDTPAVAAFAVDANEQGFKLQKTYPPVNKPRTFPKPFAPRQVNVGYHKGTFYVMSAQNFPDVTRLGPSIPASADDDCKVNGATDPRCLIGAHVVTDTRTLIEKVDDIRRKAHESMHDNGIIGSWVKVLIVVVPLFLQLSSVMSWLRAKAAPLWRYIMNRVRGQEGDLAVASTSSALLSSEKGEEATDGTRSLSMSSPDSATEPEQEGKVSSLDQTLNSSQDEKSSSSSESSISVSSKVSVLGHVGLRSLTVSEDIIGYGSHGTVVYKGTFEGRDVAIKRLLLDFYDVADHEVQILQQSDHHPNVVRYYFREKNEGFMYIALELCPASLHDVFEKSNIQHCADIRMQLKPSNVLYQIMSGIHHLHMLKIVHRDIKPQNILVTHSKNNRQPRILISDFGLGKRLADDQSSFHNTHVTAGGTVGWRAPECILAQQEGVANESESSDSSSGWVTLNGSALPTPPSEKPTPKLAGKPIRITKAVDVFSAGCVFYYVLTGGGHPFGDRFSREINILKGNFRLDKLDAFGVVGHEAKDLIRRMIVRDPTKRIDATRVLLHPYFWTPAQRLGFLTDASDRLEIEERDPPSPLLKVLERGAQKVIGPDWYRRIDRMLSDNLGKYRKYDGASVRDLLRALRNKKHHFQDLPPAVQTALGSPPDNFLTYFTSRFPALLLHVYHVVADTKLRSEPMFQQYFELKDTPY